MAITVHLSTLVIIVAYRMTTLFFLHWLALIELLSKQVPNCAYFHIVHSYSFNQTMTMTQIHIFISALIIYKFPIFRPCLVLWLSSSSLNSCSCGLEARLILSHRYMMENL